MFRSAWREMPRMLPGTIVLIAGIVATWAVLEWIVIGLALRPGSIPHAAFHFAWLWASALFESALFRLALDVRDGTRRGLRALVWDPGRAVRFALAKIVFLVMVVTGLAIVIAPGIFVAARIGWFGFVLAGTPSGPLRALADSFRTTAGRTLDLMGLATMLMLINVFGAAFLGVGLLVTIPLTLLIAADVWGALDPSQP